MPVGPHGRPALDPCGAVQVRITLAPSEVTDDSSAMLGRACRIWRSSTLVQRYRDPAKRQRAFRRDVGLLDSTLGTLVVKTPDRSMDLMRNRAPVPDDACSYLGTLSVLPVERRLRVPRPASGRARAARVAPHPGSRAPASIGVAAVRGIDVQHGWHEPPPGVRTRCSDDRLWLPFATLQYVGATADDGVLDELVTFLEGRPLNPGEDEAYEQPAPSHERASLYEHCVRAVALNMETGAHGLPLMGTCDWNDGMNLVGHEGKGESVWLGWFLLTILPPLADLAAARGDLDRAETYRRHASRLAVAIEQPGTGLGTAARTSTMERRWDRARTMNAASTPSPSPGR